MNRKTLPAKKKMSDIARLAGVSESTVSRALSNSPLINVETRERIQALAKEHNYTINKQAQNLRLQSSRTVSVVIPIDHDPRQHVSDPFFMELLGAIADALTEADYDLLLSRVHTKDWRNRVASHSYVDGLVVIGQSNLHSDINDFAEHNELPMVVWGAQLDDQKYISVGTDNRLGGRLATEHLLACGRKKIVFLGDPALPEVALRYAGFCAALAAANLPLDANRVRPCSFTQESAEAAMTELLNSGVEFDSIFAASDVLASVAIKYLAANRLAVPGQVAVVGFDDISIARHMAPALTTISQGIYQGGHALVDNLFRQMRGEPVASQVLTPQLVVRETSAT